MPPPGLTFLTTAARTAPQRLLPTALRVALLAGAELNSEIEHASPYGKAPGQKNAAGKLLLGARAARAFEQQPRTPVATPPVQRLPASPPKARSGLDAAILAGVILSVFWNRRRAVVRDANER